MKYIFTLLLIIFISFPAKAELEIDITSGSIDPIVIAIPDFAGVKAADSYIAKGISEVIETDLENSGLFDSISSEAFIDKGVNAESIPTFANWRKISAQSLLTGTVTTQTGNNIEVKFRLWDILSQKQFAARSFTAASSDWRRIGHLIADQVYTRLTGESGYFDSRIVYVAETGRGRSRTRRLAVMDQDGANHIYLTSGKTMSLTPRYDPSLQKIIYLAYYGNKPRVYIYNLTTGKEEVLGNFEGMSFAPRFSPDGKKVIMSVSTQGNSEIYEMNIASKQKTRLTFHSGIDTSPSYSADGKNIVFSSDRGGTQQLYIMDTKGKKQRRISYGNGSYATPVWSPRGDLIAFTKMKRGKFFIGVMRPDGTGERLITESYLVEGPAWSPNGRVIIYTKQDRGTKEKRGTPNLFSIDITGYNERRIKTPFDASDPAWSPLLK